MVNGQALGFARRFVGSSLRLTTDSADAILFTQHILIAVSIDASVFPFALLGIMRMAKVFGVQMVIASIQHANPSGTFAVSVLGVAVAQKALVVHLAQTPSLYRIYAPILNALRRFGAIP